MEKSRFDSDNENLEKPIVFYDNNSQVPLTKPIYKIDQEVNGPDYFAITALTNNGKFLVGDMLVYEYKGIQIYTEKNNIIFVNNVANRIFIRDDSKIGKNLNVISPEQKQYIILYTDAGDEESDSEFVYRWEACIGRTTAYDYIKSNAPIIDIDKSIVLVEDVAFNDALTVRQFVNFLKNSDMVDVYDGFNIEDYYGSDDI